MFVVKEIAFTKSDVENLFSHNKRVSVETVTNSKVITQIIRSHLGDFPILDIEEWELVDDSNVFYDKYTLRVLLRIVFSNN